MAMESKWQLNIKLLQDGDIWLRKPRLRISRDKTPWSGRGKCGSAGTSLCEVAIARPCFTIRTEMHFVARFTLEMLPDRLIRQRDHPGSSRIAQPFTLLFG